MSDPQDRAEALDEDVVDTVDDRSGDEYGDGLPEFPPDRPLGATEPDSGESFADRDARYVPEPGELPERPIEPLDELREETVDAEYAEDAALVDIGQLVDDDDGRPDDEERLLGERAPGDDPSPEQQAMHVERD